MPISKGEILPNHNKRNYFYDISITDDKEKVKITNDISLKPSWKTVKQNSHSLTGQQNITRSQQLYQCRYWHGKSMLPTGLAPSE